MNPTSPQKSPRQTPEGVTSREGGAPRRRPTSARRSPTGRIDLLDASGRLTPRDLVIAQLLDEHHTLTTTQIAALLFNTPATASKRLYQLRAIGWVDRFIPLRAAGRLDTHWVLDQLGAEWAAPREGRIPPTLKAGRERRAGIAASSHLEHTVGANQFFIDHLIAGHQPGREIGQQPGHQAGQQPGQRAGHEPGQRAGQQPGQQPGQRGGQERGQSGLSGQRLTRWWSAARTAAALGQRVHPDGHGVWTETNPSTGAVTEVGFLLEYDTGTETLDRLRDKTEPYRRLRRDGGPDYPVLFWLPNPTREANFHRKLNGQAAHLGITLATTTPAAANTAGAGVAGEGITGPIWKIAGNGRRRHRLADLPSRHGKPGAPYHPGAPAPGEDPLHLLRPTTG